MTTMTMMTTMTTKNRGTPYIDSNLIDVVTYIVGPLKEG